MMRDRKKSRPKTVGSILDDVMETTGLRRRVAERALLDQWREAVGERIAEHVQAVDMADGVLWLDADHPAWKQELSLLLPEIQRKLVARHGAETIREIRWLHQRRGRNRG